MLLTDKIIQTATPSPPKIIVYGQAGCGKTTFAAGANALLIDCENGAGNVPNLKRTEYLKTWPEMKRWLADIIAAELGDIPAIAIDTIDWMVQRICEYVVLDLDGKKPDDITNTLGTSHGGYFKAREIVQNIVYRDLLPMLNAISEKGIAIILLAHAANTKMVTPEGYDQQLAAPDIPAWVSQPFIEWADAVMYAKHENGKRNLTTEGNNLILAKNRYSLPAEIEFSWAAFVDAMSTPETNLQNKELKNG